MKKIFNPKITPGPWALPKNKLRQELVPIWAVRDLEDTEEIKSLNRQELIFNLLEEDENAFLAIPEMLEVIQALRYFLSNKHTLSEMVYFNGGEELVEALKLLDEKHGTEAG